MLKKIIPLAAVVLLAACAHHAPCHGGKEPCKCAGQATCQCKDKGEGKCVHCAEKVKEKEAKKSDCTKCRESERLDEERRYN